MDPPASRGWAAAWRIDSNSGRGRRTARDESVTRPQDAARRRHGSRGPGSRGGDAEYPRRGNPGASRKPPGVPSSTADARAALTAVRPLRPTNGRAPPPRRRRRRRTQRRLKSSSATRSRYAGLSARLRSRRASSRPVPSRWAANRLEGRLNLPQRVDDLAQAYNRAQGGSPSRGEENLRALMQSQAPWAGGDEARGEGEDEDDYGGGGRGRGGARRGVVFSISSRK